MAYTITLSDDEYATLATAAARRGLPIEALVHEALAARFADGEAGAEASTPTDPLITYMLHEGHIHQAPTGVADTPAERAERERLAACARPGKLASEMTLEDRGPR